MIYYIFDRQLHLIILWDSEDAFHWCYNRNNLLIKLSIPPRTKLLKIKELITYRPKRNRKRTDNGRELLFKVLPVSVHIVTLSGSIYNLEPG